MLGSALAFSIMGTLAHALRDRCDWRLIACARSGLSLCLATALCLSNGATIVVWRPATLWLRSLAGSVSMVCTFFALVNLPVADVLTLTNTFPVWVALLSWPMLGQKPTIQILLAVAAGLAGVCLVQRPHLTSGNFASLVALFSSLTTALAMIGLHRLQSIDPRAIVAHFSGVALVACLLVLLTTGSSTMLRALAEPLTLAQLVGVGVFATLGQLQLTKAFALGMPAKVSVVGLTQILFAVVLDWAIWGRPLEPITLAGMALTALPTAWILLARGSGAAPGRWYTHAQGTHRANDHSEPFDVRCSTSGAAPRATRDQRVPAPLGPALLGDVLRRAEDPNAPRHGGVGT